MNKKLKGFTLVEVILALTIIGVIAAIALASSGLPDTIRQQRIASMSKDFYTLTENVYLTFLNHPDYASNQSQAGLVAAFENRAGARTTKPANMIDCSASVLSTSVPTSPNQKANQGTCIYFPEKKIVAGVKFFCNDTSKNPESYSAKEFLTKNDNNEIEITSTSKTGCGFITYGFKDSKKGFREDVFTIVLGRNRVL